jgi:hypothetical protein
MLKNSNHKTSRHCGSLPIFQDVDHGLHEWDIGHNSTNQFSDESPYLQFFDQQVDQEQESGDQESDSRQRKNTRSGQDSPDETEFRRNEDEESRWQDNGGESG